MTEPLPPIIRKARKLLIEAMKLLDLHGTMRVRRVDTVKGTSFVFRIEVPFHAQEAASERARKREAGRLR